MALGHGSRNAAGALSGESVGLIAVALALTLGAGQSQLETVIEDAAGLGIGLLVAVLIGKMVAMALSLASGFMGGNDFPLIFIGGTAGVIVNLVVPDIPYALAVSCMLAAVPGSYLRAPVSMTFIAVVAMSLGPETVAPVAVAVVTSYLVVATIRYLVTNGVAPATADAWAFPHNGAVRRPDAHRSLGAIVAIPSNAAFG